MGEPAVAETPSSLAFQSDGGENPTLLSADLTFVIELNSVEILPIT